MKKITIYTTNTCAYCAVVKRWLDGRGLAYNVINLDEQPDLRQEVIAMSGAMTVPVTVVEDDSGNKHITVGWNPARLASAVA